MELKYLVNIRLEKRGSFFFFSVHQFVILNCCPSRPHLPNTFLKVLSRQATGERREDCTQKSQRPSEGAQLNQHEQQMAPATSHLGPPDHHHTPFQTSQLPLVSSHEPLLPRSQELPTWILSLILSQQQHLWLGLSIPVPMSLLFTRAWNLQKDEEAGWANWHE